MGVKIKLPDGRIITIDTDDPKVAAAAARKVLEREAMQGRQSAGAPAQDALGLEQKPEQPIDASQIQGQKIPLREQSDGFGNALHAAGNFAQGVGTKIADTVTGRTNPLKNELGSFKDANVGFKNALPIALGFTLTGNEQRRAEIIQKHVPTAEFTTDAAIAQQLGLPEIKNPRAVVRLQPGGDFLFLNKPGLDLQDITDFAATAEKFLPAAKLASIGGNLLGRAAIGGVGAGVTEFASGQASKLTGAQEGASALDVALITGLGAAAEPLVGLIGAAGRLGRSGSRTVAPSGARAELAQSLDVPITQGQAAGNAGQIRQELLLARGAKGPDARAIIRPVLEEQNAAIRRAGARIARTDGNFNVEDVGRGIIRNVREQEKRLNEIVDRAFSQVRSKNATFAGSTFKELPKSLDDALSDVGVLVSEQLTPATIQAQRVIADLAKKNSKEIPFNEFIKARRLINSAFRSAQREDRVGVSVAKKTLDKWLQRSIDDALISGDAGVVTSLKRANSLRALYGRRFSPNEIARARSGRKIRDAAGLHVEDIVTQNLTGTEAMSLIFGRSKLGVKGAADTVQRLVNSAPKGSPAREQMRQSLREGAMVTLFRRLSDPNKSVGVAKSFADDLREATTGQGRAAMSRIFSRKEMNELRKLARLANELVPPDGAAASSGTAENTQILKQSALGLLRRLGLVGRVAAQFRSGFDPNVAAARQAIGQVRPVPANVVPRAAALAEASTQAQDSQGQ